MRTFFIITAVLSFATNYLTAQIDSVNNRIDLMLLNGEYNRLIDTCKLILMNDSLNAEIYYKLGLAYQNILNEDNALDCFNEAVKLDPVNKRYVFSLAKSYYAKNKLTMAEPLLNKLYVSDSLNWVYAYYLSSIYMQSSNYDNALNIYNRFLARDSGNYVILDRTAYAYLKKKEYPVAIKLYTRSLSINSRDIPAIKNLAYLYAATAKPDTAIQILTDGIKIDSTDMDLYISRAQINYSKNYTKRALDDYLVILASGDSSKLYLKRVGIGYCFNLQPDKAIDFLLLAYKADSSDYETSSYLAQSYYKIQEMKNSIRYYKRVIKILSQVRSQLGLTYELCAQSQNKDGQFKDAIANYLNAYSVKPDPGLYINVANIYDEKLNNKERAIFYYQRFLNSQKNSKLVMPKEYLQKIEERIKYLKDNISK
jgi:tetratricopeptide (TPR) repeat protein